MDTKITKENLQEFATKLHEKNKTVSYLQQLPCVGLNDFCILISLELGDLVSFAAP